MEQGRNTMMSVQSVMALEYMWNGLKVAAAITATKVSNNPIIATKQDIRTEGMWRMFPLSKN